MIPGDYPGDIAGLSKALDEVSRERARQIKLYGSNDSLADGTGPSVRWMAPMNFCSAKNVERSLRAAYEEHERIAGAPTWRHLLVEEVAEALCETDDDRLAEELVQVAAVAVSWVEKIRARQARDAEVVEALRAFPALPGQEAARKANPFE